MDALTALFWLWGGTAGAVAIGAIYWIRSDSSASGFTRLLSSSYSPATAIILVTAVLLPTAAWQQFGRSAFLLAQVLPLSLLVYSLLSYPGNRRLHFALIPLALVCGVWQFGVGSMVIFGK